MRALETQVFDALWKSVEARIPVPPDNHPKGGHRRRLSNRLCFRAMIIRLVTGASWVDVEAMLDRRVSDTTLRRRWKEWTEAGVFDATFEEALGAYDRVIGLDFSDCALDGSQHKAPVGGEGTGKNPTDRAKTGWKWSLLTDRNGIPLGWATAGANRNDSELFGPTLASAEERGLLAEIETLHLDKGYDSAAVRRLVDEVGIPDLVAARKTQPGEVKTKRQGRGLRWPVERTHSWFINFGQLRRSTERRVAYRLAHIALAVSLLLVAKLMDCRDRWCR